MLRRDFGPQRKKAIKRVLMRRRGKGVRPTSATLTAVFQRDGGKCAACGFHIFGERGIHWSLHHRRPAGAGGDPRPETHQPGNLVLLHGNGSMSCHGKTESWRADARERGFLIPKESPALPSSVPIEHAVHGRCWLRDDGTVSYEELEAVDG